MVIALDPRPDTGAWEYVLKADLELPEAERTVWTLRPLTVQEWAAAADAITNSSGGAWSMAVPVVRAGLVGVRNLKGNDGAEVELERDARGVAESFLARVALVHMLELGTEIQMRTTLSAADVEKLAPSLEG